MTKKDYVKIAGVIKKLMYLRNNVSRKMVDEIISDLTQDLAVVFASDNPRFDQDRFLEACGL